MSITKNIGGDRLGSGNKMQVQMHNYERSTHDLSSVWRSSMQVGTLTPFMVEVGFEYQIELIDRLLIKLDKYTNE